MNARDYPEAYLEEYGTSNHVIDKAAKAIRNLRQQLAECEAERDELKTWLEDQVCEAKDFAYKLEGKTVELATVTKERDGLVAVLNAVIECNYIPEMPEPSLLTKAKAALEKVGAGKTGEQK